MISSKASTIVFFFIIWMGTDLFTLAERPEYRLPFHHRPIHYQLSLELDPETDKFYGEVVVRIVALLNLNLITLHASPSRITHIKEIYLDNDKQPCNFTYMDDKTELLNISCGIRMAEFDENNVVIKYEGAYGVIDNEDGYVGFYKSSYKTPDGERIYAITQSEPIYARSIFPCYDEPEFKAPYNITVKHPDKYNVLSNAGIYEQTHSNG